MAVIAFILSTGNLIYNAAFSMKIIREEASSLKQGAYSLLNNNYERIYNNLKEYDDSLYRTEKSYEVTFNDAMVYEANGITYSGSTYSKETHNFLNRLGMKSSHVHVTYNYNCTKAVDMILGIKYLISVSNHEIIKDYEELYEEDYFENKVKILKNPYNLSLGFCVNEKIINTNMKNHNTFSLQNEILKNMTGVQENVYKMQKGKINKKVDGLELKYGLYKKTEDEGKITYEFEIESTDNAYIYLCVESDEPIKIHIDNEDLKDHESITEYEMINLGKRQIGEKIKLEILPEDYLLVDNIYVAYENEEILKKHYEALSQCQVTMQRVNGKTYIGNINVNEDEKYILFSIPYEEGWKITIDGKEVTKEKALDALMAIKVDKGEHRILLEYTPPRIIMGIISTLIGIMLFELYIIYNKKKKIIDTKHTLGYNNNSKI